MLGSDSAPFDAAAAVEALADVPAERVLSRIEAEGCNVDVVSVDALLSLAACPAEEEVLDPSLGELCAEGGVLIPGCLGWRLMGTAER